MPINSLNKNSYSELITEISKLTLTGGSTGFKYAKPGGIVLQPDQKTTILGSSPDCLREIYLLNKSPVPVDLFWFDGINSIQIPQPLGGMGSIYRDWSDGGLELQAQCATAANLMIWIRSNKPINYQVGTTTQIDEDDMPVNLLISKAMRFSGGQFFYADSFKDGLAYDFTFNTNGLDVDDNLRIHLFPINFLSIPRTYFVSNSLSPFTFEGDYDVFDEESTLFQQSIIHNLVLTEPIANFDLTFYRSKFTIAFSCLKSDPMAGEYTRVLKEINYTPNTDPTLGGTFTLTEV